MQPFEKVVHGMRRGDGLNNNNINAAAGLHIGLRRLCLYRTASSQAEAEDKNVQTADTCIVYIRYYTVQLIKPPYESPTSGSLFCSIFVAISNR